MSPHSTTTPPRVLIATRIYPPEAGAGAFRLRALANALTRSGAAVRILTSLPPSALAGPRERGVSRFPVLRDAGGNVRGYAQYLSFDIPLFFRLLMASGDIVVSEPPPTTGLVVAVTSWIKRRPYAYFAADIWSDAVAATSAPSIVTSLVRFVERAVLRHACRVLAVSQEVADRAVEHGAHRSRIDVVGNGIDTSTFRPDGPRASTETPCFVYTGTMSEWQGPRIFIEAMPAVLTVHPTAQLSFYGQGSAEGELRRLASQVAPDNVTFEGIVSPSEVASRLRSSTAALVSIVPGIGYDFARPTKIYAASACGTPVVFAGQGAGADLVTSNGLGYRADYTPASVAEAMIAAIEDADKGVSAAAGEARAHWTARNASLQAAGRRGATGVLTCVGQRRGGLSSISRR